MIGRAPHGWISREERSLIADRASTAPIDLGRAPHRSIRLAAIGTAAGAFSALFGVGGGTVIVPLLILWLAHEDREATGTSLAAIVVIAALGAAAHALYGNVDPLAGVLIGAPAVGGVLAGTALQQRLPERFVSAAFAVLLVASAVVLVI